MPSESLETAPSAEVVPAPSTAAPEPVAAPQRTVEELYQELVHRIHDSRPDEDLSPLEKAFQFAADRHKNQKRNSGEPYMVHPLLVTRQLADMSMDMVCLQTGLLHDVVEDT